MKKRHKHLTMGSVILNIVLLLFSITCLFPIIWMFYSSFNTVKGFNSNPVALPTELNFKNYVFVLTKSVLPTSMLNSLIVTIASVFLIIAIGFILGYFLARYQFKGHKVLYNYFLLGMLIPIHALLIPINILMKNLGLTDNLIALILVYTAFGLPISVFLVESYVHSIPKEMEEAAAVDGAKFSSSLFRIVLPMTTPILSTVAIIEFFRCWNEFAFGLILINNTRKFTVTLALANFKGLHLADYPRIMAGTFFSMLPVMILYFIFSRKIMDGMVTGAVKG